MAGSAIEKNLPIGQTNRSTRLPLRRRFINGDACASQYDGFDAIAAAARIFSVPPLVVRKKRRAGGTSRGNHSVLRMQGRRPPPALLRNCNRHTDATSHMPGLQGRGWRRLGRVPEARREFPLRHDPPTDSATGDRRPGGVAGRGFRNPSRVIDAWTYMNRSMGFNPIRVAALCANPRPACNF
jgi:hypothetical protein